jgi:hypothetical protein
MVSMSIFVICIIALEARLATAVGIGDGFAQHSRRDLL